MAPRAQAPRHLSAKSARAPGFREFVALVAACMALVALAIDAMLPALPAIGRELGVADANALQWIIAALFIGLGVGQLLFGALSDWLGRRPVLLGGLAAYVALGLAAAAAPDLPTLIALRFLQGLAAGPTQVVTRSMVRDLYDGDRMAQVMSLAFAVFLLAPIFAPALGALILLAAPWRTIFLALAAFGALLFVWSLLRLPETLRPEQRRAPSASYLGRTAAFVITERNSLVYTLSATLIVGALLAYVSLTPQIFEAFGAPELLAPVFAGCAAASGVASLVNARLVTRYGARRLSHLALGALFAINAAQVAVAALGGLSLPVFAAFQACTMAAFALAAPNFGAIAMERMGAFAGAAASLQGVATVVGGGLIAATIGQQWRGDPGLVALGFAVTGALAIGLIVVSRRNREATAQPG